jgi:hypothetical protein
MIGSNEPRNIQIIRECLEMWFSDVTPSTLTERFIYHDGTQTSELALDRELSIIFRPSNSRGTWRTLCFQRSGQVQGKSFEQGLTASLSVQGRCTDYRYVKKLTCIR